MHRADIEWAWSHRHRWWTRPKPYPVQSAIAVQAGDAVDEPRTNTQIALRGVRDSCRTPPLAALRAGGSRTARWIASRTGSSSLSGRSPMMHRVRVWAEVDWPRLPRYTAMTRTKRRVASSKAFRIPAREGSLHSAYQGHYMRGVFCAKVREDLSCGSGSGRLMRIRFCITTS